ncbi:MAG: DUF3426 domain-containing protein [Lysobacteraceae bacterium]
MFINCPYCKALVATDPVTDLAPVRCPHCESLLRRDPDAPQDDDMQPPLDVAALLRTPVAATPAGDMAGDTADIAPTDAERSDDVPAEAIVAQAPPRVATAPAHVAPPAPVRGARRMPSFVHAPTARTGPRERWLPLAIAALCLTLVLQLLLADRARLAADARWRPLLGTLCAALRCDLPPWREPSAFTLVQRDISQDPRRSGALRVTATFRNDARWAQPWPQLRLTLTDANGRASGERSFRAEEYLGGPPDQPMLASGESASVAMDILEPASDIVGYDFAFR